MPLDFVAIDFETANYDRASACAIGVTVVRDGAVARTFHRLVRPPDRWFEPAFTDLHGIAWEDVADQPAFPDVWAELKPLLCSQVLAAHNAAFDRSVLNACLANHRLRAAPGPFACTMRLARRAWNIRPTRLPDVCRALRIPLKHHDAASDAEASARIAIAAARELGVEDAGGLLTSQKVRRC